MKIHPSSQRLLVKLQKEMTWPRVDGGVVIRPFEEKKESEVVRVVAVGSGKLLDDGTRLAPVAEVGDVVVVYRGSGYEVAVDGEEHRMVHESEVLGVVAFDVNPSLGSEGRVNSEGSSSWRI